MKVLYGTTNLAKINSMKKCLRNLDIQIVGLMDMDSAIPHIEENGLNPLENAVIKAKAYYETFKMPVFSCDSGLYIEGLDDDLQPSVHVRRVKGKELSDDEMQDYYTSLVGSMGGKAVAWYKNAICYIPDSTDVFTYDKEDICSHKFLLIDKPHIIREAGFPLDSISVDIKTGMHYYAKLDNSINSDESEYGGFENFFARHGIAYKNNNIVTT